MKTFILGMDGLTFTILDPYMNAGLLPNFKKVVENGSSGKLRSTIPPTTPPAWTSLATGKNPGKHGIFEFRRRAGYKTDLITKNTSPYAEPLWNILSKQGKRVMIANVPFTYPPDEVNGIMISGMMTPNIKADFVFPKEVKQELLKLIPDYQLDVDEKKFIYSGDKKNLINNAFKITDDGRKMMNHFIKKGPWDLFFITFIGPDRLQHLLWDEILDMKEECVKYFQLLDDILGDILKSLDDTLLFIVSDHGFRKAGKLFHINNFMKDLGLLKVHREPKIKKVLNKISITGDILNKVLYRIGLLDIQKYMSQGLVNYLKRFITSEALKESEIDWQKTRAFSLQGTILSINLKGREPEGIVDKQEYPELCKYLKKELLTIIDQETGKNIIKDVFIGDEIYSAGYGFDNPDLVVLCDDGYSVVNALGDTILSDASVGIIHGEGDHDIDGLFFALGNIIHHKRIDADICDIMPTILYAMSLPIPKDVDGRVLIDIIKDDFLAKNKIKFERAEKKDYYEDDTLTDEETELLKKRLKELGYLG